jgi:multisubunit Na+/H+ antiporter MnhE subunit
VGRCIIEWIAFLLLWLCFTFSVSVPELLAGAACASVTVVAIEITLRAEPLCFSPTRTMLSQVRYLPLLIVKGLWVLVSVLWTRMRGGRSESVFRDITFHATGTNPEAAAKRALVVSFSTTPPNSIVAGIDLETNEMLLHQIRKTPLPEIIRNLETCP